MVGFDPTAFLNKAVTSRDARLLRHLKRLTEVFPVAALHREALQMLGSDFIDARERKAPSERGCWTALVRFGEVIERRFGLTREVMVYYSPYDDLQLRTFERLPRVQEDQPRRPTQDLFMIYAPDPLAERKLDDWTVREPFAVVGLPLAGVTPAEAASRLLAALTDRLAARNLYEETLPVTGRDFFGRKDLLISLAEELRRGRVCGVFGLRKTGKTSLVKELGRRFESANSTKRIFILRDLEDLPTEPERHVPSLLADLTTSLLPRLREHGLRTHELRHLPKEPEFGEFRRALQATLGDKSSADVQFVIAFDEIESFVGPETAHANQRPHVPELLGALRSLVQENDNFNVLISGLTSAVLEAGLLYGRENPLFAWAKPFFMPPLSMESARDLVEELGRRMAVEWKPEALDVVYSLTEGHVFLHRTLCARIAGALPKDLSGRTVTEDLVLQCARPWRRGIAEQVHQMMLSMRRFYPEEADVLGLIREEVLSSDEVEEAYPAAMNHLINLGLIAEEGGGFQLTAFSRLALGKK
ncbi:ATP-binding protein [Micromonospora sp. NPDC049301]|uniref:ATP-binding protein n=1 Tax=Micromonospora sp. NPDC049301 TaxID=3155723 RepID=UPI00343CA41F